MIQRTLNPNEPIVIGLCGEAGTGKTSVARSLVPADMVRQVQNDPDDPESLLYVVDHLFLAIPLYELATIKIKTEGEKQEDRILYSIHETLLDIFNRSPLYGAPSYAELRGIVHELADLSITHEGKPRKFLQTAGDICRAVDQDCFVKWVKRRILTSSMPYIDNDVTPITIVSDVRFPNEAEFIKSFTNGLLIKYTASEITRLERIQRRDGFAHTPDASNHISEKSVELIDPELIDETIDSTQMSVQVQAKTTQDLIIETFDLTPF